MHSVERAQQFARYRPPSIVEGLISQAPVKILVCEPTLHVLPEYLRNRCNKAALAAVSAAGPLGVSKEEVARRGEEVEQIRRQRSEEDTCASRGSGEWVLENRFGSIFQPGLSSVEVRHKMFLFHRYDGTSIAKNTVLNVRKYSHIPWEQRRGLVSYKFQVNPMLWPNYRAR